MKNKIKILYLEDDPNHRQQLQQLIDGIIHLDLQLTASERITPGLKDAAIDILLISDNKYAQLLDDIKSAFPTTPLIYLQYQSQSIPDNLFENSVGDVVNMDRVTNMGMERTIKNTLEKNLIIQELVRERDLLKKLTDKIAGISTENYVKSKPNFKNYHQATRELLTENKYLLDLVQQQNFELQKSSHYDLLTRVPNRLQFEETLISLCAHAKRHEHILALLYIDLYDFNSINNQYGHDIGNELLKSVAHRLRSCLRTGDFIARVGDDEFAVILHEIGCTHDAGVVANKILENLQQEFIFGDNKIAIDSHIGIACYPMVGDSSEELIKNAEIALMRAQEGVVNNYYFATLSLQEDHVQKMSIEKAMKHAIDNHEFYIVYQPIFSLKERRLYGFEALLRWENPELGAIPPDRFIPIAEDNHMIIDIGYWVMNHVCRQVAEWHHGGYFPFKATINLSPIQLKDTHFADEVSMLMKKHKLSYDVLEFEITEKSISQENGGHEKVMQNLVNLGVTYSLDDFGTGVSSLSHLSHLPISTLKIDRRFLQDITTNENNQAIIKSIIAIADKLGLKVIAEGIENKDQLDFLQKNKCHLAQGFYFSKPLSCDSVEQYLIGNQTG